MGVTSNLKLPYPELTEIADGPDAFNDLVTAVESYFYDRVLPTGVTRMPSYYWGAGTAFPAIGVQPGDVYRHTGLGCLMTYNGTAWRQAEPAIYPSLAARNAASTNHAALLHDGFRAFYGSAETVWRNAAWRGVASTTLTLTTFAVTDISGSNNEVGIAQLAIPDPGFPYVIDTSFAIGVAASAATQVNVRARLDAIGGTVIAQDAFRAPGMPAGEVMQLVGTPFPTGELTGTHTVIATARRTFGTGSWSVPASSAIVGQQLTCQIRPV